MAVTETRAGKRSLVLLVDVPAHVDPALRLVVEGLQRRRLDRIDGDAGARLHDADDAVAGHGAFRREAHRQVAAHAADRHGAVARLVLVLARGARPGIWNSMPAALRIFDQPSSRCLGAPTVTRSSL